MTNFLFEKSRILFADTHMQDEEIKFNQDVEETNLYLEEKQNAETQKETKKASGKQKLKDLGLDDDEIKALMGV